MALITLQVLEGMERGQVYAGLPTPVTIGREDDNVVRLNDERVSRFHAKIQEDSGRVILTDLDSTNGTRVNGHPVQMRVLQIGDQVSIGRCLLVYGSREEILAQTGPAEQSNLSQSDSHSQTIAIDPESSAFAAQLAPAPSEPMFEPLVDQSATLFPHGPPLPPEGLGAAQRAEISDFLAYAHEQVRQVLHASSEAEKPALDGTRIMQVPWPVWQRMLTLEMDLAVYLRRIADPNG